MIGSKLTSDPVHGVDYNYTTGGITQALERDDPGSEDDADVTRVKIEEGVRAGHIYEYVGEDVDLYDYDSGEVVPLLMIWGIDFAPVPEWMRTWQTTRNC